MRPYSGTGVLQIPVDSIHESIQMYDDPGIKRCCTLDQEQAKTLNAWLFGHSDQIYMFVTSRKGEWLEVEHDEAGRTGWLTPQKRWQYTPWEQFLKGRTAYFLRNSPKKLMQLFPGPLPEHGTPLTPAQRIKIIKAHGDWANVLVNHSSAGWIRWRDSDGRLLTGFNPPPVK